MMTVCQPWIIRSMSQSILIGIHSGGWKLKKREWTMKRKNISKSMVHLQLLKQEVLGGSTQKVPTNTTTGNTTASCPVMIGISTCIPSTKWKMMTSFEDTWESYDWADFYAQPVWSSFDYDKIYVPPSAKWEDSWMEYEKFDWEKEDWNITYWEMDKYEYEKIAYGRTMNSPMMRMVGHTLPPALKRYLSNYACGIDIGGEDVTPECKKAKDDFAAADGTLEEMTLQGACLEHCGEACGFLVNSVSFLLMSLCYFLFNEMH